MAKIEISQKGAGFAFGNRVAKVYTALLNKRATDAFALTARCTALASVGDPILEEKARHPFSGMPRDEKGFMEGID